MAVAVPLVSVLMLAYNHEQFVAEAVESALAQRGVDIELVIGDDASQDRTPDILRRYAADAPDTVRLVSRPVNVGMFANFADLWAMARGRYVAILEADDFWTHPTKLAEQTRALDANPEWTLCFHRVRVIDDNGLALGLIPPEAAGAFDWARLTRQNFVQTCSVVYRGGIVPTIPAWMSGLALLDWPLHLLHVMQGPAGFLDEEWAVYRQHEGGAWSPRSPADRHLQSAEMLRRVAAYSGIARSGRSDLMRSRSSLLQEAAVELRSVGDLRGARKAIRRSLAGPLDRSRLRDRIRLLADLYAPGRTAE